MKSRYKDQAGFTLMEILIVMAIVIIIAVIGFIVNIDFYRSYAFNSERDLLIALLQKSRSTALSNINQANHGLRLDLDNQRYFLYDGVAFIEESASNQAIIEHPESGITLTGDLLGEDVEINFEQLTGKATAINADCETGSDFCIKMTDGKRSTTIIISREGRIDW